MATTSNPVGHQPFGYGTAVGHQPFSYRSGCFPFNGTSDRTFSQPTQGHGCELRFNCPTRPDKLATSRLGPYTTECERRRHLASPPPPKSYLAERKRESEHGEDNDEDDEDEDEDESRYDYLHEDDSDDEDDNEDDDLSDIDPLDSGDDDLIEGLEL